MRRRGQVLTGLAVVVAFSVPSAAVWLRSGQDGVKYDPGMPVVDPDAVVFSELPSYLGVFFADELQAEQRSFANNLVPDQVTITAAPDLDGRFTSVVDGVRSSQKFRCECPSPTLWRLGGSVAFGLRQRDDETIASELSRLAAVDGISLDVTNLAVPGWTITKNASR